MAGRSYEIDGERSARCSVEDVVALLRDSSSWPDWQPEITSSEGPSPLSTGDTVRGTARMLGFGVHGHSTVIHADKHVFTEDVVVGVRMWVTYEVRAARDGTTVAQHLHAELPDGIAGRVFSALLRPRLRRMQRAALRELVRRAEAE